MKTVTLFLILITSASTLDAAGTYYVRSGASGSNNGSDWNNAYTSLPTTSASSTYYVAAGTYTSWTISASGVTIKKANAADNSGVAGWDASFAATNALVTSGIRVNAASCTINGVTGGGPGSWITGFGFKVKYPANQSDPNILIDSSNPSGTAISHCEVEGNRYNSDSDIGNQCIAGWHPNNVTVSYCYLHDAGVAIIVMRSDNLVVDYTCTGSYGPANAIGGNLQAHSEIMSLSQSGNDCSDNVTIRYNLFTHVADTGGIMWCGSACYIYGNVFYCASGDDSWGYGSNGVIGDHDSGNSNTHNLLVYNNTFIDTGKSTGMALFGLYLGDYGGNGCMARNNLMYGDWGAGFMDDLAEHSYNFYVKHTRNVPIGSQTVTNNLTLAQTFTDAANLDFTLKTNSVAGTNLGSSYNVDMLGHTRTTWTRGALEFDSGETPAAGPRTISAGRGNILRIIGQ
jgi:hypothetical protein